MATKKTIELKGLAVDALNEELKIASQDLNRMKFDHAAKGLENPDQIKGLKKDIARLKTEIRAREIASMTKEELAKRSKIRLRRK
ncbi:MAG: 50S ribosomal protein L29 [Saprospiraceae bacterium]|jgi:large subunit ribosomal protein L29|nr:50S ribosomal protein L29 [Saprospiraceae bacterium]